MFVDIQDIIDRVDIVEYIGQYIDLEENNGELFGICPFHKENTASFSITPERGLYYCFGCGASGSVITFIQQYHKCNFRKALEVAKQYADIPDNQSIRSLDISKTIKRFKKIEKREKEAKYQILDDNVMDKYDRNQSKLKTWIDEGISIDVMSRFQVRYDPFSNRIVFPIRNPTGQIINISGRTLDPQYKEKKIRKYNYFQPLGRLDTIYGLYENITTIKEKNEIIIFEGAKSVLLASTWGIENTGAVLTSHLNPYQLKMLLKLGVRVVFALDDGVNVKEDTNIMKLKRFIRVEVVKNRDGLLLPKMSPVDAGLDVWMELYERRVFPN